MILDSYLAVTDGVAQSKVFNLQDEDAVVELDEVASFLLLWLADVCFTGSLARFFCSCWNTGTKTSAFMSQKTLGTKTLTAR